MPNFFEDNEDILFRLEHADLRPIVDLWEGDFSESKDYPYASDDYDDAMDNYRRVLSMIGEICGDFIEPRAEAVDEEGPTLNADGSVTYPKGMAEALERVSKADLMGFTMPRRYGGLNFPGSMYTVAVEMVSRADAALMNVFGLQDISETINDFGSEEQKQLFLPRFCSGEVTGAMALTEPDAGSDLQVARLSATQDPETGQWKLNGTKRFITNGCGEVLLVLARSEEGTVDGRGLSMLVAEGKDGVKVRRLENKLGIHGVPTCELGFKDVPALLVGQRRRGLTKYVMSLMNGARIGIAAQGLGIAEAAYHAARKYAAEREQFGKKIQDMPPVAEMLVKAKVEIEVGRALLYETAKWVDLYKGTEKAVEAGKFENKAEEREAKRETTRYRKMAGVLTPMSKYYLSELACRVSYDAIQVHGGSGFMKDFPVERHFRDARITTIYEGTSELQVVAMTAGLMSGEIIEEMAVFAREEFEDPLLSTLAARLGAGLGTLRSCLDHVREKDDTSYTDLCARKLCDIACDVYMGYLALRDAKHCDRKKLVAKKFVNDGAARIAMNAHAIKSDDATAVDMMGEIIGHIEEE